MSSWQLAELEKAIVRSRCLYVWIDRLALPQEDRNDPCQTKLLLARWMTCSPFYTLCSGHPEARRCFFVPMMARMLCPCAQFLSLVMQNDGCLCHKQGDTGAQEL